MELKLALTVCVVQHFFRFNRTFMELKPAKVKGKDSVAIVLIAPLWN